jgi:hypothetical protein
MQWLGERGRPDRRFRRLAENSCSPPILRRELGPNSETGWRDARQSDRDGRAPQEVSLAIMVFPRLQRLSELCISPTFSYTS